MAKLLIVELVRHYHIIECDDETHLIDNNLAMQVICASE